MFSNRTTLFALVSVLGLSAGIAKADFAFGAPSNLGPKVNGPSDDHSPFVSADELELYFDSYRAGGFGDNDIWVTTRATTDDEWGGATNLGPLINSSAYDGGPCLSPDGLSLYFGTLRSSVGAGGALMVARRPTKSDNWGTPVVLNHFTSEWGGKAWPTFSSDDLQFYVCEYNVFDPDGFGLSDLWVSTRSSVSDAWSVPQNLGPIVNSASHDRHPSISADGRMLFFSSYRPGGHGDQSPPDDRQDIWVTKRATEDDDWGTPVNLGPTVNTSVSDGRPSISADGHTLYFYSRRPGGRGAYDLWQAPIEPTVDFDGDGITDLVDLVMLMDNWGTDDSLYDIGPMPWGDGKVDIEDLKVFIAEWEKENPPALVVTP